MWLHSLHSIVSKAIDEYEHCHSSVMWLIKRGARATSIRARRSNLTSDRQITDMTFAGVGILCTHNVNSVDQGFLSWLGMNCDTSNGLNKAVFIRTQGLSQVTSIDLYCWLCKVYWVSSLYAESTGYSDKFVIIRQQILCLKEARKCL